MTAVTPPVKSESGFLNTRDDTESGDTSAASPAGRKKSMEDRRLGSTAPTLQAPSYCATAKGRMTRRDDGNEGPLSLYLV